MIQTNPDRNVILSRYVELEKDSNGGLPPWLVRLRKTAVSRFADLGFPTTRQEEWRTTSVEPIARTAFEPVPADGNALKAATLEPFAFADPGIAQFVFVNGRFAPRLSSPGPLPAGVKAGSLAAALESDPGRVEPHLARYAAFDDQPFTALNTAFLGDGAFVHVPDGVVVQRPVHLLFITTPGQEPVISQPRTLVLAGDGAQVTLIESYAALEGGVCFTNAVSEIVAGRDAVVDHYRIQRDNRRAYHVATQQFQAGRGASCSTHSLSLGGGLVRNDVNAVLDGEGADCVLNGLFLATGTQHVDNHTRIDHAKPHCSSRELYKGILADQSRGIFSGRIIVRKDAQKTDSKQTNKNLLLSEEALVDTRPQLEIYADDVKCTHGATIGQLDEESIFYLRSRGIARQEAHAILIHAFAGDIVNRVKVAPVRARLDAFVSAWLPAAVGARRVA